MLPQRHEPTSREIAIDDWWRFGSAMSTAVAMSASMAHLMELPAKMHYDAPLYVKLHRTLYPNFGRIAGIAEISAVVATAGLAWWTRRKKPAAYPLTLTSAAGLATAHAIFWNRVQPANKTIGNWPLDSIPRNWADWRNQWEYSHAARAVLITGALGAVIASAFRGETGRD